MINNPTLMLWIVFVAVLGLAGLDWWERRGMRVMLAAQWMWRYRVFIWGGAMQELRKRRLKSAWQWVKFNVLFGRLTQNERVYAERGLQAILDKPNDEHDDELDSLPVE